MKPQDYSVCKDAISVIADIMQRSKRGQQSYCVSRRLRRAAWRITVSNKWKTYPAYDQYLIQLFSNQKYIILPSNENDVNAMVKEAD